MAPGGADDHEETVPPAGPPGAGGAHGQLPPGTVAVGAFVGPYKLLRYLDEGGMGEVWLAERRDTFRQRVALKLLTPGRVSPREAIARFDQEREVLASLSHDHVARIYDGGIHVPILDRLAPEVRAGLDTEDFMPQLASVVASGLRKVGRAQQAADLAAEAIERMRIAFGPDDERTPRGGGLGHHPARRCPRGL